MRRRFVCVGLSFLCIAALVLSIGLAAPTTSQYPHLSSVESGIASLVNGTEIYDYDFQLEKIALNHSTSLYSFRSSGSIGANETASWIQEQFVSFGLEARNETFEQATWNLLTQPLLTIDGDGNLSTTNDQTTISSFQCEHYSWPTSDGGVLAGLVTLPQYYDPAIWIAVNTTGKVLLIGGEVESSAASYLAFRTKITAEKPAAIIFTWETEQMAAAPTVFNPCGGLPISKYGPYFWNLGIPVGWVNYDDGQLILNRTTQGNVFAFVSVNAVIEQGPHYNIIGKLQGSTNPEKMILVTCHYDTVVDAGFCSDGAGTAAVVELAKVFSEAAHASMYKPEYTLVFVAFAGEELGYAGSVSYVKQHASELGNIAAVINLDSIGSATTEVSTTFPDNAGLDLQSVVINAADDLGLTVRLADPGGSDQEAFRNPAGADDIYQQFWGTTLGIGNATRVESSTMISSYPLTWTNTENDNSASTATLGWVAPGSLQNQTLLAGLSVMRVSSGFFNPFILGLYGFLAAAVAIAAVAYLERSRLKAFLSSVAHDVRSYIGGREVLYVIILTVIFLFASFALHARLGETEVISGGYPRIFLGEFYGTPFEMFRIDTAELVSSYGSSQLVETTTTRIVLLWEGLVADVVLFSLCAFAITFAVAKVRYLRVARRAETESSQENPQSQLRNRRSARGHKFR